MNIRAIPLMAKTYDWVVGLSDHSFGSEVSLGAVALGAKVIEKHVTIKRADGGPDAGFSMEMEEFKKKILEEINNKSKNTI
mgnify:CR=1 FL=1